MDEIMHPPRIIMTMDYNCIWHYANWRDWTWFYLILGRDFSGHHGNHRLNICFVDGHVEEIDRLDPEYFDDAHTHWTPQKIKDELGW